MTSQYSVIKITKPFQNEVTAAGSRTNVDGSTLTARRASDIGR